MAHATDVGTPELYPLFKRACIDGRDMAMFEWHRMLDAEGFDPPNFFIAGEPQPGRWRTDTPARLTKANMSLFGADGTEMPALRQCSVTEFYDPYAPDTFTDGMPLPCAPKELAWNGEALVGTSTVLSEQLHISQHRAVLYQTVDPIHCTGCYVGIEEVPR